MKNLKKTSEKWKMIKSKVFINRLKYVFRKKNRKSFLKMKKIDEAVLNEINEKNNKIKGQAEKNQDFSNKVLENREYIQIEKVFIFN